MTTQIPTNLTEAVQLQKAIERTYKVLIRATERGKSLRLRTQLAERYIKQIDHMLEYKRERAQNAGK